MDCSYLGLACTLCEDITGIRARQTFCRFLTQKKHLIENFEYDVNQRETNEHSRL